MTWKERRTITLLLSILGILFAVLLVVLGIRYRENRPAPNAGTDEPDEAVSAYVDPEAYSTLCYYNGKTTLSFALNEEGAWIWTDIPDFPLDDTNLKEILDLLSKLHFQQTITTPETMESYQLDDPKGTLTVTDSQGGAQTLAFGKATTDGDSRYLQLNGDESTIYIVDNALYQHMQTPIYDMTRLPEFPDLSEKNLRTITVQLPAPETESEDGEPAEPPAPIVLTASRANGAAQPALWFCENSNVTSSIAVQKLLADLQTMAFSKCIDYRPSDEAASICGFDAPEITLTVEYGTDASILLEIGGTPLHDAGRYARLEDGDAIYLLSEEKLDGLFKVAAREFER
ncbi:MAG: DUF4340 domain-containing protein [Oscillibacter sp.]|nr:DUF4340 domain-containing protein [Oscillibacter sp.]MCI8849055.1 DUF4340 domain-containing protein [Oscillibacter sp.]MCI9375967.1 DUF4340 domain-containing protein [Oscillibacter sp.]